MLQAYDTPKRCTSQSATSFLCFYKGPFDNHFVLKIKKVKTQNQIPKTHKVFSIFKKVKIENKMIIKRSLKMCKMTFLNANNKFFTERELY